METLTFNDKTILEYSHAIQSGDSLYLYIQNGYTLQQVFNLLIDQEKTKKIICDGYGDKTTYIGYKVLNAIKDEGNNMITAVMKKA